MMIVQCVVASESDESENSLTTVSNYHYGEVVERPTTLLVKLHIRRFVEPAEKGRTRSYMSIRVPSIECIE